MMRSEILSRLKALIQRGAATQPPPTHPRPPAGAEMKEPPVQRRRPSAGAASGGLAAAARAGARVDERRRSTSARPEQAESRPSPNARTEAVGRPRNTDERTADGERRKSVEEAAYYRAERRGFQPGFEVVDWLEAEREVDARRGNGRA